MFCHDDVIFIVYLDDGLFFRSDDNMLTLIIRQLKSTSRIIEDQGHPGDYIRVNIKKVHDRTYKFTQYTLADAIIDDVNIGNS